MNQHILKSKTQYLVKPGIAAIALVLLLLTPDKTARGQDRKAHVGRSPIIEL